MTHRLQLPVWGERVGLVADGGEVALQTLNGESSGRIVCVEEDETLHVRCLEVDALGRGYGSGSEAAALLERAAREAGYRRLTSWAPPDIGLAVYFWIRMGFRPRFGAAAHGGSSFELTL